MAEKIRPAAVAAIPTWNMREQAVSLVSGLQTQEFDALFVLDDRSTDNTAGVLRETHGDSVHVVEGAENIGAAGNRNRIMGALAAANFRDDTIVTFVDADTELIAGAPTSLAEVAVTLTERYPRAGIIGGTIYNPDGTWGGFNYGPPFSLTYVRGMLRQVKIEQLYKTNPEGARRMRDSYGHILAGYPDIFAEPGARTVGWVAEGLTIMQARTFGALGGYDPTLHFLEAVDMGERVRRLGLDVVFDPEAEVRHLQIDVRGKQRTRELAGAIARLAYRHYIK